MLYRQKGATLLSVMVVTMLTSVVTVMAFEFYFDLDQVNRQQNKKWHSEFEGVQMNMDLRGVIKMAGGTVCLPWRFHRYALGSPALNKQAYWPQTPIKIFYPDDSQWQMLPIAKPGKGQYRGDGGALYVLTHRSVPVLTALTKGSNAFEIAKASTDLNLKVGDVIVLDDCLHAWMVAVSKVYRRDGRYLVKLTSPAPFDFLMPLWMARLRRNVFYLGRGKTVKSSGLFWVDPSWRRFEWLDNISTFSLKRKHSVLEILVHPSKVIKRMDIKIPSW